MTRDGQLPNLSANPDLSLVAPPFLPAIVAVPSVSVPAMIVLILAVVARPVTCVKLLALIAGGDPRGAFIGRARVIAIVPNVTIVGWIPVAVNPCISRSRVVRTNPNHARRRRRADPDAYGELPEQGTSCQYHQC